VAVVAVAAPRPRRGRSARGNQGGSRATAAPAAAAAAAGEHEGRGTHSRPSRRRCAWAACSRMRWAGARGGARRGNRRACGGPTRPLTASHLPLEPRAWRFLERVSVREAATPSRPDSRTRPESSEAVRLARGRVRTPLRRVTHRVRALKVAVGFRARPKRPSHVQLHEFSSPGSAGGRC